MKRLLYGVGRVLQIAGLLVLPSAIWVGHFNHDEKGAILIFAGSVIVFFTGAALSRIALKA